MEREELLKKYRYILRENKHIADLKAQVIEQEKVYVSLLQKEKQAGEEIGGGILCMIPLGLAFLSLVVAVIGAIQGLTGDGMAWLGVLFYVAIAVIFFAVFYIVYTVSFAKHDRDRNAIVAARIHNEELIPAYQIYLHRIDQVNHALSSSQIGVFESELPERYRTENAVTFFVDALESRRADNEKELFNLYEEELHRKKLEQIELEKLQKIDDALVHCPKCGSTRCRMIPESETYSTPFGVSEACCGFIFLGPVGLLCGLCGMESSTKTKMYWVCSDCGKKFSDAEG